MQAQGLAMARYLDAPAAAAGMAGYNLACAQARSGRQDQAARTLAEAVKANPDLAANARRDPDLRVLREASPHSGCAGSLAGGNSSKGILCSTPPAWSSRTCLAR